MRIIVAIVSGMIFYFWGYVVAITAFVNWVYALIVGKRIKELGEFSEIWATNSYYFVRYLSSVTNERPFPFTELKKNLGKFE